MKYSFSKINIYNMATSASLLNRHLSENNGEIMAAGTTC